MNNPQITAENTGISQLAANIVNNTFLGLDGFEPLRRQMDQDSTYPAIAFAYELARIVDREIRFQKQLDNQRVIEALAKSLGVEDRTLGMSDEELAA